LLPGGPCPERNENRDSSWSAVHEKSAGRNARMSPAPREWCRTGVANDRHPANTATIWLIVKCLPEIVRGGSAGGNLTALTRRPRAYSSVSRHEFNISAVRRRRRLLLNGPLRCARRTQGTAHPRDERVSKTPSFGSEMACAASTTFLPPWFEHTIARTRRGIWRGCDHEPRCPKLPEDCLQYVRRRHQQRGVPWPVRAGLHCGGEFARTCRGSRGTAKRSRPRQRTPGPKDQRTRPDRGRACTAPRCRRPAMPTQ